MNRRFGSTLLTLAVLFCGLFTVSAWADSQARIVRLSDVEGNVQIDRGGGESYEKAFLNMPITEDVRLRTNEDARAEVEFEDGSTIHLVPNTVLHFTNLSLRDSGAKVSTIDLQQGQAYVNFTGKHDDEFKITFAEQSATLTRSAHFRIEVDKGSTAVAVFKGDVQVEGPAGAVEIGSKHTATFDVSNDGKFELAKNITQSPFDSWDKQQTDYHLRYAAKSYDTPYSYGMSDLNYYGSYYDVPGYGMCWQPYFTGFGWDPFMDGAWMWYPGFGYSWVSAYPWGWTPYHYGSWLFVPGYGWMWRPGSTWVAWNQVPTMLNPPRAYVPPRPPVIPHGTVVVGRGPTPSLVSPGVVSGTKLVIKEDRAGLGVPRGVRNLPSLNRQFETRGATPMPAVVGRNGIAVPANSRAATAAPAVRGATPRMSSPRAEGGFSGSRSSAPSHSSSSSSRSSSSHR
jgi:hypothetical protein